MDHADDFLAPRIQHHGNKQGSRRHRHERAVGDPQVIGSRSHEVPIHQVRRRSRAFVAPCRSDAGAAAAHSNQPSRVHQEGDPLATIPLSSGVKFSMQAAHTIRLPRLESDRPHLLHEKFVAHRPQGRPPLAPCVIAGFRHTRTRAVVAVVKPARFALMNSKIRPVSAGAGMGRGLGACRVGGDTRQGVTRAPCGVCSVSAQPKSDLAVLNYIV